jgi:hypothetical protein
MFSSNVIHDTLALAEITEPSYARTPHWHDGVTTQGDACKASTSGGFYAKG